MAEPRKVQFVTLSALPGGAGSEGRRRRLEEDGATEVSFDREGRMKMMGTGVTPAGDRGGLIGKRESEEPKGKTVRLNLCLSEPNEENSAEFNYCELVQSQQAKKNPPLKPVLDAKDPFNDDERERLEVEALAKKFESKYSNPGKKRRKDRMQDLIDIGFGYDESDPFIDNSEAYDELVPASLTTKLGGFYINTGTLQFRAASESEGEDMRSEAHSRIRGGEEPLIKRRKKKDVNSTGENQSRKNKVTKQGVAGFGLHHPEKKKRKKLMKDSLCLAAMLRRFSREKEDTRKREIAAPHLNPSRTNTPNSNHPLNHSHLHGNTNHNDLSLAELTSDPTMMSLLGTANESELQDIMRDLDFSTLDAGPQMPLSGRENGQLGLNSSLGHKIGVGGALNRGQVGCVSFLPLPEGLPAALIKRIEDLRAASRQFDQEGRKKFFTLDMNNILLDIELQVQEQPAAVRSEVYGHLEAFVPCNKEALLKRLKKLSLNIQDDRLRTPLLKLKLAVCSAMPEQIARYNMDCMAKAAAKQQIEDGEKNGSEDDDEEKPGKRVMGPRKKFIWDDKLRALLCNLVHVKLSCFELEQCSLSVEDYLKAFMENEVKPLWPKGWMQTRGKKRTFPTPKTSKMDMCWVQRPVSSVGSSSASPATPAPLRRLSSPSEPICLSDSLDEDLATNSLDSISHALTLLSNAAKGLTPNNGVPTSPPPSVPRSSSGVVHYSSPLSYTSISGKIEPGGISIGNMSSKSTSPSLNTSPSSVMRTENFSMLKDNANVQRHSATLPQRAAISGMNTAQPAKPRPPPTSSPLLPPQQRSYGNVGGKIVHTSPSVGPLKNCVNKSITSSSSVILQQSPHLNTRPQQSPPQPSPSPYIQVKTPSIPHNQSNFITPMQATITKSSHSSNSPIIKLTPHPPPPTSSSSTPSSTRPRPPITPISHQYTPKSPSFRPPFTTPASGVLPVVKSNSGPANYNFSSGHKSTSPATGVASITNSPLIGAGIHLPAGGLDASPSSLAITANHSPQQRSVGGLSQCAKSSANRMPTMTLPTSPAVSAQHPQSASSPGSSLLGPVPPSLPLGFGMLGGLVPVSLPFQFPSLLNFTPSGPGSPARSTMGTSTVNTSGYTLAQDLFKSLQPGTQLALPPHMQLAFSDENQSQGSEMKRKSH